MKQTQENVHEYLKKFDTRAEDEKATGDRASTAGGGSVSARLQDLNKAAPISTFRRLKSLLFLKEGSKVFEGLDTIDKMKAAKTQLVEDRKPLSDLIGACTSAIKEVESAKKTHEKTDTPHEKERQGQRQDQR